MKTRNHRTGFIEANREYGAAASPDAANRALARARRHLLRIRAEPDGGGEFLMSISNDEDPWVRLASCQYLLPIFEDVAKQGLEALQNCASPAIRVNAKLTLQRWKDGYLRDFLAAGLRCSEDQK